MINNASQHPQVYYCRHMQPGTARYENETILVDSDGMKSLLASVGKRAIPVYINHQDVDLKNIKEQAAGYVTESFYNELDGWGWFKFLAVDDSAHEAIKKGWSVSNAYMPTEWGPAGTKNNVPYNREVRNGEFTHLAIVPDPRYEGACIMSPDEFKNYQDVHRKKLSELKNSKETTTMKINFFKTEKKAVSGAEIDRDTHIELENGMSVSIGDMIDAVVENSKQTSQKVKVGDKEMTVEELAEAFLNAKKKMKKNAGSKESDDMEKDEDIEGDDEIGEDKKNKKQKKNKKSMKNADDCDDMENDAEDGDEDDGKKEKKNAVTEVEVDDKFFNEMRNAHLKKNNSGVAPTVVTSMDGIQRGKDRYGSGSK